MANKEIWSLFTWIPSIGCIIQVIILQNFYKLRDKLVHVLIQCNTGIITREE
jgi:Na+/melibiose symporter-like transporter